MPGVELVVLSGTKGRDKEPVINKLSSMNEIKTFSKIIGTFLLVFFVLFNSVIAQFSLSAELRPRAESRHGFRTLAGPDSEAARFVSQRSRLNFDFKQKKYRTKLSVQDVRVWGDEEQLKNIASFSLHEAWAEVDLSSNLSIKMGRQELIYDDHRLLGNVGWAQQARSHDAAIFKYIHEGWKMHLGLAFNSSGETLFKTPYSLSNYKSLSYLWINKAINDQFKLSLTGISDGFQTDDGTEVKHRITIGPHLVYNNNGLLVNGTFYYQFGKNTADVNINAKMLGLQATYKINKTSIGLGIDHLSGTDALDTGNSDINTFHTLYATNHKFYGFMDYFLNIPGDTNRGGLNDFYNRISYAFDSRTSLTAILHYFSLSSNVAEPDNSTNAIDKGLGTEIDLVLSHKIQSDVGISMGWSIMVPTASMQIIKGGDEDTFQSWAWFMFTIKPTFFTTKSN